MTYPMMNSPRDWIPAARHKRSQNTPLVTPVDEVIGLADALMLVSSRTEGKLRPVATRIVANSTPFRMRCQLRRVALQPSPEKSCSRTLARHAKSQLPRMPFLGTWEAIRLRIQGRQ